MADTRITEKFEYKTDILTSYSNKEQRIKVRQYPRHTVSYDYSAMNDLEAQWIRGLMRTRQSDIYYIPMWHNVVYLSEDFMGGKQLYIDKDYMYNLYNCDAIEIFRYDDVSQGGINITKNIDNFGIDSVGLKSPINQHLSKDNTFIYPLIKCVVQPTADLQYVYACGSQGTLNFEDMLIKPTFNIPYNIINGYQEDEDLNRFYLPTTVNGKEVCTFTPQWVDDDGVGIKIEKNVEKLDTQSGIFEYDLRNTTTYDVHTIKFCLMNKKMINNMIRFFKHICGMYKSFYAPSWANDVSIHGDVNVNNNYIYTEFNQYYQFYSANTRRKKIVIFTKDKHSYIFDILAYSYETVNGVKYGKIIFSQPPTVNIAHDNVLMISYFNLVRLDSDELQLDYESNIVATTSLIMKEVDDI